MKHTIRQLIIHLRKVAEVLKREVKILWDRVEWDDDDLGGAGKA